MNRQERWTRTKWDALGLLMFTVLIVAAVFL